MREHSLSNAAHISIEDLYLYFIFDDLIVESTNFNDMIGATKVNGSLTHWGRETHICVSKLTIIASDNGLSPGRRQAIIWTNVGILLIGPLGTNFNEINRNSYIFIQANALENVVCEMASILSRLQCVKSRMRLLWQKLTDDEWCWRRYGHNNYVSNMTVKLWFIEGEWRIYALVNKALIGWDNGLSHGGSQVTIWANIGI